MGVTFRPFKRIDLRGGILIVGMPEAGIAGSLVVDHLLEEGKMDHLAAYDHPGIEPVAMIYAGKARFPVRIHADPASKTAVLGSETSIEAEVLRDLARATVAWCKEQEIRRIVALDTAWDDESPGAPPSIRFVSHEPATSQTGSEAGLEPVENGILAGLAARLLLEARLQDLDVVALIAVVTEDDQDVESSLAFLDALPTFAPEVTLDKEKLAGTLQEVAKAVRGLQKGTQRAMARLGEPAEQFV